MARIPKTPVASVRPRAQGILPSVPGAPPLEFSLDRPVSNLYAGTSGWAYPTWRPGFYPEKHSAKRFLEFYASKLNAVEVNYTFRKLPSVTTMQSWLASTPPGFRFSFKAPQRITHFSRLRDSHDAVGELTQHLEPFREAGKLGPILFQLPPNFKADAARLAHFLAAPAFHGPLPWRVAFEFRHTSWFNEEVYDVLRNADAALCIAESDDLTTPHVVTAGFACFRLRHSGGYVPLEIEALALQLGALSQHREVYAFFKHEDEPTGALNAVALLNETRAMRLAL